MLVWGGIAYIDLAWSLFQFLAVGLLLIWIQDGDDKLLVLSGIMQGLALGSKYVAFSGAAIIVLCIVWFGIKNRKKQKDLFKGVISPLLKFGVPALLVASPWYLKNFIWTGNPIFPTCFSSRDYQSIRTETLVGLSGQFWDWYTLVGLSPAANHNLLKFRQVFYICCFLGFP